MLTNIAILKVLEVCFLEKLIFLMEKQRFWSPGPTHPGGRYTVSATPPRVGGVQSARFGRGRVWFSPIARDPLLVLAKLTSYGVRRGVDPPSGLVRDRS